MFNEIMYIGLKDVALKKNGFICLTSSPEPRCESQPNLAQSLFGEDSSSMSNLRATSSLKGRLFKKKMKIC